jgi:hypothetical protein
MTNSPAKKWQPYGYDGYILSDRPRAATPAPSSYSAPAASYSTPAQSGSTIGYLQYVTYNWLLAMVLKLVAYNGSTMGYLQLVTYNWILTIILLVAEISLSTCQSSN